MQGRKYKESDINDDEVKTFVKGKSNKSKTVYYVDNKEYLVFLKQDSGKINILSRIVSIKETFAIGLAQMMLN